MFDKSSNFNIHQSTLIDAAGATFNHVHGARSGIDTLYGSSIADAAHDSAVTEPYKSSCLEGTRMQHIDDITAWTARRNQSLQHRLLWMHGPAGVGKSAIAKSCAEKTAAQRRLGASFFFSRTQHVDDPLRFFTTIAHQLTTETDEYRKALHPRIQRNPALLTKGIDAQFRELIIEPFLELAGRGMDVQDKMVIIDGLDECNGDPAQHKIMELVAKSVMEHGNKILLLWAFFSRPELHIDDAFSPYVECFLSYHASGDNLSATVIRYKMDMEYILLKILVLIHEAPIPQMFPQIVTVVPAAHPSEPFSIPDHVYDRS